MTTPRPSAWPHHAPPQWLRRRLAARASVLQWAGSLLLAVSLPLHSMAAAPAALQLRVMTLNIFYGGDELDLATGDFCDRALGCPRTLARIVEIVRGADADVVGFEEGEHSARKIAQALGYYHHERTQTISRYPLADPPGADGNYVFAEVGGGRVVAIANMHLPSDPYGPYAVRDGATRPQVMDLERTVRLPAVARRLPALQTLAKQGIPVFITGDFNSPSHLDWTPAVAQVRPDVPFAVPWPASVALANAGFRDSYREIHPDPLTRPGFTWTPGGPESDPHEVFDRIDWVLASGPAYALNSQIVGEAGNPAVDLPFAVYPTDHRGVISTYTLFPGRPPPYVAAVERRLFVGETGVVRVNAPAGSSVEIVATAAGTGERSASGSAHGRCDDNCASAFSFPTDGASPGPHEAVLRNARGQVISRSPLWLYAAGTPPSVSTGRRVYRSGEPIDVDFAAAPGLRWDWVALFRATGGSRHPQATHCNATSCGSGNYLLGHYTGTAIEGRVAIDGSWVYDSASAWPLAPGVYEIRLLLDDGYRQLAYSAPFEVVP